MGVRITKKVRDWNAGETTEPVTLTDEALQHLAGTLVDIVNGRLISGGRVPVTVHVQPNIEASVLVAAPKDGAPLAPANEGGAA